MMVQAGAGQAGTLAGWALVVDPSALMRESIRLYLAMLGWRARVVAGAGDALAQIVLEPQPPGLLVCAEADDGSVFDWIQLHYGRSVPALVLTGEPDARWIGAAERRGVAVFYETAPPIDLQELLCDGVRYVEEMRGVG